MIGTKYIKSSSNQDVNYAITESRKYTFVKSDNAITMLSYLIPLVYRFENQIPLDNICQIFFEELTKSYCLYLGDANNLDKIEEGSASYEGRVPHNLRCCKEAVSSCQGSIGKIGSYNTQPTTNKLNNSMKSRFYLIKEGYRLPLSFYRGFPLELQQRLIEDGGKSGMWWEVCFIQYMKKFGWTPTKNGAAFDCFDENGKPVEIRVITKASGAHWEEAHCSGSKGTLKDKMESLKVKLGTLGDDGYFVLIDISDAFKNGANIYKLLVKDWKNFFRNEYRTSYTELKKYIEQYTIDNTNEYGSPQLPKVEKDLVVA